MKIRVLLGLTAAFFGMGLTVAVAQPVAPPLPGDVVGAATGVPAGTVVTALATTDTELLAFDSTSKQVQKYDLNLVYQSSIALPFPPLRITAMGANPDGTEIYLYFSVPGGAGPGTVFVVDGLGALITSFVLSEPPGAEVSGMCYRDGTFSGSSSTLWFVDQASSTYFETDLNGLQTGDQFTNALAPFFNPGVTTSRGISQLPGTDYFLVGVSDGTELTDLLVQPFDGQSYSQRIPLVPGSGYLGPMAVDPGGQSVFLGKGGQPVLLVAMGDGLICSNRTDCLSVVASGSGAKLEGLLKIYGTYTPPFVVDITVERRTSTGFVCVADGLYSQVNSSLNHPVDMLNETFDQNRPVGSYEYRVTLQCVSETCPDCVVFATFKKKPWASVPALSMGSLFLMIFGFVAIGGGSIWVIQRKATVVTLKS